MLKTANRRIAAFVLVGGVITVVFLLWYTLTEPINLVLAWFDANLHFLSALTDHDYIRPFPDNPITLFSVVAMSFFTLSYFSGWLLALRLLLKDWRGMRALRVTLNARRSSAMLILIGGVITAGSLIWYMDYCHTGFALAWLNVNFIVAGQFSSSVIVEPNAYSDVQTRAANVTLAALAFSYALSLLLAVMLVIAPFRPSRRALARSFAQLKELMRWEWEWE